MQLIEHIEVGSGGQASITFSSIPQTYTDLYAVLSLRSDLASTEGDDLRIRVNGITTSVYSNKRLKGAGSAGASSDGLSGTNVPYAGYASANSQTANTFGNTSLYFPNYSGGTAKSMSADGVSESNATQVIMVLSAWLTSETTAISSIEIAPYNGSNFVQYSSATLYGIRKYNTTSDPKATGGIISYDSVNNYWVHTFTASGTLTPTEDLSGVEYLVIAGGGGGGRGDNTNNEPGGGGAGGYRSSVAGESSGGGASAESSITLTASTNYTVTVGAGGSGSSPANGSNSSFFGITSLGGGYGAFTSNSAGGASGGSGGGGAHNITPGGSGTTGQGYDGGTPTNSSSGAGGGGAGQAGFGGNYISGIPAHGGDGVSSSITGTAIYRAGGGAGFVYSVTNEGGLGGGASHSGSTSESGSNGAPGTGGGGSAGFGNAGSATAPGGNGGSGVVIVRYAA